MPTSTSSLPQQSLLALLFLAASPCVVAQEGGEAAAPMAAAEVVTEGGGESISPIPTEGAGLTTEGAGEVADVSLREAPVAPASFLFNTGVGAVYDNNIYQTNDDTVADTVLLVSAGFTWTPRVTDTSAFALTYNATLFHYLEQDDLGGDVNHNAALAGKLTVGETSLTSAVSFQRLSGSDLSLSGSGFGGSVLGGGSGSQQALVSNPEDRNLNPQDVRDMLTAAFGFSRPLAGKTSVNGGVNYTANLYEDPLPSTQTYSGQLGLGYLVGARTTVGVSGVIGRTDGDDGSLSEDYEQFLGTVSYDATEKLDFSGSAGLNFRQSDVTGASDRTDFVFNISTRYQWRDRTGLFLTAGRNTQSSVTELESAINRTTVYVGVDQRIADRWSLQVSGGYDLSDYEDAQNDFAQTREETFLTGRVSLNFRPTDRATIGLFNEYRQNDAGDDISSYEGNRLGLQVGVQF